jgi:hypothetical protein
MHLSCSKKEQLIEVYLPKKPIPSFEGLPLEKAFKENEVAAVAEKYKNSMVRFDTINHEVIYFGKFIAEMNDLQSNPFIRNDEIRGFDLNKSLLITSKSARNKMSHLKTERKNYYGNQFVLCIDKKPIISGYLIKQTNSIFWSNTYEILYDSDLKSGKIGGTEMYQCNFIHFGKNPRNLNMKNEKELLMAFKSSGRLIE